MQNERSEEDLRDVWQQQPAAEYRISLELLRLRARELEVKSRFQSLTVGGFALALIVFDIWNWRVSPYAVQRGGFLLACGWALYALIHAGQSVWPTILAKKAGTATCLVYSRNELQRRLAYSGSFGRGLVGPILSAVAVFVGGALWHDVKVREHGLKSVPVLVLFVIWIVMFVVVGRRDRRRLRRELAILNDLDNGTVRSG